MFEQKKVASLAWVTITLMCLSSCRDAPVPKPRGYHRITLPTADYHQYQHPCGPRFELPQYSKIELIVHEKIEEDCWFNVSLPTLKAKVHCSYIPLQSEQQLIGMVEDAHQMVFAHEMKATGIGASSFNFPEHNGKRKELHGITCRFWRGLSGTFARGPLSLQKKRIATT